MKKESSDENKGKKKVIVKILHFDTKIKLKILP